MTKTRDLANLADLNFDSGTMVVDKVNDRVGIGTNSPSEDLHIKGQTSAHADVIIEAFTGYNSGLNFHDNAGMAGRIVYNHSSNFMEFDTNGSEAMRIDSSGNVGIGGSPSRKLHIIDSGDTYVAVQGGTSSKAGIFFGDSDNHTLSRIRHDNTDNSLQFSTNEIERARIDSSGNLLVGTTDNQLFDNTSGSGLCYRPSLSLDIARESTSSTSTAILLNNTGVDSRYITFRKDGTDVGSIGVKDGTNTYIGSGAAGFAFSGSGPTITPYNTTANNYTDNTVDLGNSFNRFKDLYLSGGVYLGGTGSANKLDDYEEGTWTPVYESSAGGAGAPTVTYTGQTGRYSKVGNLVYAWGVIQHSATSGGSGYVLVGGLPFTGSGVTEMAGGQIGYTTSFSTQPEAIHVTPSGSNCYLYYSNSHGSTVNQVSLVSQLVNASHSFYFSVIYTTTA